MSRMKIFNARGIIRPRYRARGEIDNLDLSSAFIGTRADSVDPANLAFGLAFGKKKERKKGKKKKRERSLITRDASTNRANR